VLDTTGALLAGGAGGSGITIGSSLSLLQAVRPSTKLTATARCLSLLGFVLIFIFQLYPDKIKKGRGYKKVLFQLMLLVSKRLIKQQRQSVITCLTMAKGNTFISHRYYIVLTYDKQLTR
jgi:hypothetical protein